MSQALSQCVQLLLCDDEYHTHRHRAAIEWVTVSDLNDGDSVTESPSFKSLTVTPSVTDPVIQWLTLSQTE